MSLSLQTKPKLAAKAQLRHDRKNDQHVLLYPEKGLLLNPTGTAIVKLCTGKHTLREIIDQLAEQFRAPASKIQPEVVSFLDSLLERGLLQVDP